MLRRTYSKSPASPQPSRSASAVSPQPSRSASPASPQPSRSFTAASPQPSRSFTAASPQPSSSVVPATPRPSRSISAATPQLNYSAATATPQLHRCAARTTQQPSRSLTAAEPQPAAASPHTSLEQRRLIDEFVRTCRLTYSRSSTHLSSGAEATVHQWSNANRKPTSVLIVPDALPRFVRCSSAMAMLQLRYGYATAPL